MNPCLSVLGACRRQRWWPGLLAALLTLAGCAKPETGPPVLKLAIWFAKASIVGQGATLYHLLMAATLVVILPLNILFLWAQRAFTESIAMSGMKE